MRQKQISLGNLARKHFSPLQSELENVFFGKARRLEITINGQSYLLTLDPLAPLMAPNLGVLLQLGDEKLQLFFNEKESLRQLDSRLSAVDWPSFPEEIQRILLESIFQTSLAQLGNLFGGGISLAQLLFDGSTARHSPEKDRFGFQFQLHSLAENATAIVLSGTCILSQTLAKNLAQALRSQPLGRVHSGRQALPPLRNVVGEILLSPNEIQDLQIGDVLLLPDAMAFNEGQRRLTGLLPYEFRCKQQGNQLKLEKVVVAADSRET